MPIDVPLRFSPMNPTRSPLFIRELGLVVREVQARESDVSALLAKEKLGYVPVFALDFEILHSFLFPQLQKLLSRVQPRLAAYLIQQSNCHLVLPPGTIKELVAFAGKYFPLVELFEKIRENAKGKVPNIDEFRGQIEDLFGSYKKIISDDPNIDLDVSEPEKFLKAVKYFQSLGSGFRKMQKLFASNRLQSLDDFFPGWEAKYRSMENLVADVAGAISAQSGPDSKRGKRGNLRDAENVVAMLAIYQDMSSDPTFQPRLVTETRPILKLNGEDYGQDEVLERLLRTQQVPCHRSEHSRVPFFVTTVSVAVVYASMRRRYRDASKALSAAKQDFRMLSRREWEESEYEKAVPVTQQEAQLVNDLLASTFGAWYFNMRTELSRGAIAESSLQWLGLAQEDNPRNKLFREAMCSHPLSSAVDNELVADKENWMSNFGINVDNETVGTHFPCQVCRLTWYDEKLWESCVWEKETLQTCEWEHRASLKSLVDTLNKIIASLKDIRGEVVLNFGVIPRDREMEKTQFRGKPNKKTILVLPSEDRISNNDLIQREGDFIILPDKIFFETELGDCSIDVPVNTKSAGSMVHVTVNSEIGTNRLLLPLLRDTHCWCWNAQFIDYVSDCAITNMKGERNAI